jgi:threonine aldolase
MDGARFANALVGLNCSPADMTWRTGVDILSFGATKNGGMNAEAVVVFNMELADDLSYRLRQAGQTWSKMRFSAAQLLAYVEDNLFLASAHRANALAARLGLGLCNLADVKLFAPIEANEIFLELPEGVIDALTSEGFLFYRRSARMICLVCRFDGTDDEVDMFLEALRSCLGKQLAARG